jgi:hypothetical protein|tara:strand:+ start:409 stop:582 length:174 start_codon:yes stop_codon:yes gene_type:complete
MVFSGVRHYLLVDMKDLIKTTEAKSKGNLDTITSDTSTLKEKLIAIVKQMILMFSKK